MKTDTLCSNCGASLAPGDKVCPQCNTLQDSFRYRSRMGAASLAFFAGWFGGHRFFLGQWWGVFYLLFCWTAIPSLIAWIEGVVFLVTDQRTWNQKHNHGIDAGQEGGTAVLVVVALVLPLITLTGILAAIAIPAYVQFSHRAELAAALAATQPIKAAVVEYAQSHDDLPASYADLKLDAPAEGLFRELRVDDGVIFAEPDLDGVSGAIILTPARTDQGFEWDCTDSTVEPENYLPPSCR